MSFAIKDFLIKSDQILSFLHILSHLLEKSLMEKFIFLCVVISTPKKSIYTGKIKEKQTGKQEKSIGLNKMKQNRLPTKNVAINGKRR